MIAVEIGSEVLSGESLTILNHEFADVTELQIVQSDGKTVTRLMKPGQYVEVTEDEA